MNKRKKGSEKELLAAEYLTAAGMRITERNFRCRQGEIDIIGLHQGCLVFVEVKYRKNADLGTAAAAVNMAKQRQICRVADVYRFLHKISERTAVRYDVVAIQDREVEWFKNAFSHIYTRNGAW